MKEFGSSERHDIFTFEAPDAIRLWYAHAGMQQWQEAIDSLKDLHHNKPISMNGSGVWGEAFDPVLPGELYAYSLKKLGKSPSKDPRIFQVETARLCFSAPPVFITDQDGLWVAAGSRLLNIDFDEKTNLTINLPKSPLVAITALCQNAKKLYIGTAGEGLIEYDKESHKCRQITYRDGLLMDDIACLAWQGRTLWIGFGANQDGGLGKLDMESGKISSLTPSLPLDAHLTPAVNSIAVEDPADGPPRHKVTGIAVGAESEIWVNVISDRTRVLDTLKNTWRPLSPGQSYPAMTKQQREMLIGLTGGDLIPTLVIVSGHLGKSPVAEGLPDSPITTLDIQGDDLWVGGYGFIAKVDMKEKRVRKLCYLHTRQVDHLEVAGDYLWAQFNWRIFRVPLADVN
jgi:hypothetical protein